MKFEIKDKFIARDPKLPISETNRTLLPGRKVIMVDGYEHVYIHNSPFGNCQIFSIAEFDQIISKIYSSTNKEEQQKRIKDFNFVLKAKAGKNCLCIDVHEDYLPRVKEIFSTQLFRMESPYKNKTGSNMVMLIIDLYANK